MDYNNMNNYRNQIQESLIDAIKILYDGAITNEKIPKTLECIVSDDSKREQGIYKVKYMHNEFAVSCPLSEVYNCGDAVIVLVPDGDFSKTKIITGSADASGKSSSTDVEANPAAPATQELNKVRIGDIVYDIPEGGGTENAVKDVIVNGISVVTNQIARLSAVSQQELINALSTKVNVTDFETLESEVDNLSDEMDEKASQQDLDDLSSVVDGKADTSDVEAELAEKVDLSTYNTDMSLKADKTALNLKQDQIEFNTLEAATETLTRLKADNVVYNLGGGTEVVANPSESATDDLETIKIGETVYDISGGGSSTNYGKFKCDVLFNTPVSSSGWDNPITICTKSVVEEYDVLILTFGVTQQETATILVADLLSNQNSRYYYLPTTNANGSNFHVSGLLINSNNDLLFYVDASGDYLYKVYGLKFENKLINRSDIYSEEERMIGRWTDGKPLYQKTVEFNFTSNTSDWTVFDTSVSYDRFIQAIAATKGVNATEDQITSYQDVSASPRWCVKNDHKLYYYLDNAPRKGTITLQYTKTIDSADSGVIPEDPMFISDPMIYSEEEQVVGSWTDGKPLYQKTWIKNLPSAHDISGGYIIDSDVSYIDSMVSTNGYIKESQGSVSALNGGIPLNGWNYGVHIDRNKQLLLYDLNSTTYINNGEAVITLQYTKTTDPVLSGPKKGKIVQRSDIYSEEERLVGRWTDGKPLYQRTITKDLTLSSSWQNYYDLTGIDLVNVEINKLMRDNEPIPLAFSIFGVGSWIKRDGYLKFCVQGSQASEGWVLKSATIQYTKTTDAPFSKQLIEDPQFVMMSDYYSEDEQVVGRWTDGKPLYQKTIVLEDVAMPNAYTEYELADLSSLNIEYNVKIFGIWTNSTHTLEYPIPYIPNYNGSPTKIATVVYKTDTKKLIGFANNTNFSAADMKITLQYTKTTDASGTGPTKGNLIYLPSLYSEEEREVGVWTDGKPLYQKTIAFDNTSSTDKIIDISSLGIERLCYTACSLGTSGGIQIASDAYYMGNADYFNCYYNNANSQLHIRRGSTWYSTNDGYVTIQYTKVNDIPGSGTWTPEGQFAHRYSETEQVIGTWIDGNTRYERTYVLRENGVDKYTIGGYANREYQIGLTGVEYTIITQIFAKRADGNWDDSRNISTENVLTFNRVDGSIYFQNSHSASDVIVVIQYNKSS